MTDTQNSSTTRWRADVRDALGPGYTEAQVDDLARIAHAHLEIAVGERLSEGLSDEELRAFDELHEADDDAIQEWLKTHRPHYREVVAAETKRILDRLVAARG